MLGVDELVFFVFHRVTLTEDFLCRVRRSLAVAGDRRLFGAVNRSHGLYHRYRSGFDNRTNLSPFTKGCRVKATSMRVFLNFWGRACAATNKARKRRKEIVRTNIIAHRLQSARGRVFAASVNRSQILYTELNLPGWRKTMIKQMVFARSSCSLHSEVSKVVGASSGGVYSIISVCGSFAFAQLPTTYSTVWSTPLTVIDARLLFLSCEVKIESRCER